MKQTEADIRANKPMHLFTIGEKAYNVPLLPIVEADVWSEQAETVVAMEKEVQKSGGNAKKVQDAKREFTAGMLASICAYHPDLDCDEVRNGITGGQLAHAFHDLRAHTDPFDQVQSLWLADLDQFTKSLPNGIPTTILDKAFASQNPGAS